MTAEVVEQGKLDIGRVLGGTFQVIGRNIVAFSILGLLLAGLPTGLLATFQATTLASQTEAMAAGDFSFGASYFANVGLGVLVAVVTTAILQGALIFATVQDMNGRKPQIGEALATGLRNFLGLIAVSLLFGLAVAFGTILLIVPGIMIACAWCVAVPALVAERTGVFGAFSRSGELTRGNRWRVFALFVVLFVILMVVSAVLGAITAATFFANPDLLQNPTAVALSPVNIIVNVIQQTISGVFGAALTAVLYVELRSVREGLGPQALADVFS